EAGTTDRDHENTHPATVGTRHQTRNTVSPGDGHRAAASSDDNSATRSAGSGGRWSGPTHARRERLAYIRADVGVSRLSRCSRKEQTTRPDAEPSAPVTAST